MHCAFVLRHDMSSTPRPMSPAAANTNTSTLRIFCARSFRGTTRCSASPYVGMTLRPCVTLLRNLGYLLQSRACGGVRTAHYRDTFYACAVVIHYFPTDRWHSGGRDISHKQRVINSSGVVTSRVRRECYIEGYISLQCDNYCMQTDKSL
jgi:hypothetical protein